MANLKTTLELKQELKSEPRLVWFFVFIIINEMHGIYFTQTS